MHTTTTVRVIACQEPAELYHRYPREDQAQPVYILLDLRKGALWADWDGATEGRGSSPEVYHGYVRRYPVPVLTAKAANEALSEILPLAERIAADWSEELNDQSNYFVVLGQDAQEADAAIRAHLGCDSEDDTQGFSPDELVAEWEPDGTADDYDITGDTTDERLDEIEQEVIQGNASVSASGVAVVPGLSAYLRQLRDDLKDSDES